MQLSELWKIKEEYDETRKELITWLNDRGLHSFDDYTLSELLELYNKELEIDKNNGCNIYNE